MTSKKVKLKMCQITFSSKASESVPINRIDKELKRQFPSPTDWTAMQLPY